MAGCEWQEHLNVRYLMVDYTGVGSPDEALAVLRESVGIILAEPDGVRIVVDAADAELSRAFYAEIKIVARTVYVPRRTTGYLYGIPAFGRLVLAGMQRLGQGRDHRAFRDRDEALAALVADSTR